MDLGNSKYRKELEIGLEAAEKAGEIIDSYMKNGFDEWKKDDESSVTEADIESQKAIVSTIKEAFTEDGFLGEEEHLKPDDEKRVWIIDPVDGTFNFKKGFGHYCVSIALEAEGETVVGIVHSPETALGKTYFAVKEGGSYVLEAGEKLENATEIGVSDHPKIQNSILLATTSAVYPGEMEKELELLEKFLIENTTHRQLGSCALELCYLAAGRADMMYNPIAKKWDYAAGKLIIEESSGKVRIQKSEFPNSYEIAASNGKIQEELEEILDN